MKSMMHMANPMIYQNIFTPVRQRPGSHANVHERQYAIKKDEEEHQNAIGHAGNNTALTTIYDANRAPSRVITMINGHCVFRGNVMTDKVLFNIRKNGFTAFILSNILLICLGFSILRVENDFV